MRGQADGAELRARKGRMEQPLGDWTEGLVVGRAWWHQEQLQLEWENGHFFFKR